MRSFLHLGVALALLSLGSRGLSADVNLPKSFAGWKSVQKVLAASQLEPLAGNDAEILREYGVLQAERREYASREQRLAISLYRFRDSSGSYGMFTFWREGDMDPLQLPGPSMAEAAGKDSRLLASFGDYLADIRGSGLRGLVEIELREMLARLAQGAGKPAPLPTLPSYLPSSGLVENSDRYLLGIGALERLRPMRLGDWVGFAYGAEAVLAHYQLGEQTQTLIVLLYPTPQLAMERSKELERYFAVNEEKPKGKLPPAFLKRAGPLVALVLDTSSASVASFLLDRVDYRWDVTWSERPSRKDEPSWGQILIGIFIGSGLLLLFCLLVSVAFGGLRLLLSHFFPGKIFDRPSTSEIIRLHLDEK